MIKVTELLVTVTSLVLVPLWTAAKERIPLLQTSRNPVLKNCPDNFTPNGKWILGEVPEVLFIFTHSD